MARKKKRKGSDQSNAELLPPREALSLLNTDPSAYTSLLGDPTAAGAGTTDPTAGATDAASSTASSAHDLADAQAAGGGEQTVSDQPQTISADDTQTASSET
jgi:hypothetical protein